VWVGILAVLVLMINQYVDWKPMIPVVVVFVGVSIMMLRHRSS
jgi:hypothetical protein